MGYIFKTHTKLYDRIGRLEVISEHLQAMNSESSDFRRVIFYRKIHLSRPRSEIVFNACLSYIIFLQLCCRALEQHNLIVTFSRWIIPALIDPYSVLLGGRCATRKVVEETLAAKVSASRKGPKRYLTEIAWGSGTDCREVANIRQIDNPGVNVG